MVLGYVCNGSFHGNAHTWWLPLRRCTVPESFWRMFCNFLQFGDATFSDSHLQLSVILFYNKQKKTKDIIIQGIIFSLVPAIFSYLGQSDNVWNYLVKKQYIGTRINISVIKDGCLVFSIVFTFIFLTFNLICSQIRENLYKKEWISFVRFNKEIFVKTLTDALGKEYSNINIRIFIPDKPLLWRIKRIVYKKAKLSFVIKNIEGLANPGITNNLSFEVEPTSQGLDGECYNKKQMLYDDSLETSNETNYNLNGYQINKTNNLKFILVCPLFDINERANPPAMLGRIV